MHRIFKHVLIFLTMIFLGACSSNQANEFEYTALEGMARTNAPVTIPEETAYLTMEDETKQSMYDVLDEIGTHAESTVSPVDYSHIEDLATEKEYIEFLESTNNEASLLYIGFDECPWCKAFSPKINQIASELNIPIYYYNTRAHEQDLTYAGAMQSFEVETVPHVFIMEDGEPKERINQDSSMQQIESFFKLYTEEYN